MMCVGFVFISEPACGPAPRGRKRGKKRHCRGRGCRSAWHAQETLRVSPPPATPVTFPAKSHRVRGLKVPPCGGRALAPAGVRLCGAPAPPGPLPAAVPLIILQVFRGHGPQNLKLPISQLAIGNVRSAVRVETHRPANVRGGPVATFEWLPPGAPSLTGSLSPSFR
jgi:hypothetical protein